MQSSEITYDVVFFLLGDSLVPECYVVTFLLVRMTYEDGTEYSEKSACKIETLGNHPKEEIQHSQSGESLNRRTYDVLHLISLWTRCCVMHMNFMGVA